MVDEARQRREREGGKEKKEGVEGLVRAKPKNTSHIITIIITIFLALLLTTIAYLFTVLQIGRAHV